MSPAIPWRRTGWSSTARTRIKLGSLLTPCSPSLSMRAFQTTRSGVEREKSRKPSRQVRSTQPRCPTSLHSKRSGYRPQAGPARACHASPSVLSAFALPEPSDRCPCRHPGRVSEAAGRRTEFPLLSGAPVRGETRCAAPRLQPGKSRPGGLDGGSAARLPPRPERRRNHDSPHRPHVPLRACADRKSTRLNSSHPSISYAVFCLKKKKHLTALSGSGREKLRRERC